MYQFILWFAGAFNQLLSLLDSISFNIAGYDVSYLSLIVAFLLISMVISIFWKGAKV